jgi:hypothetical protein
MEIPQFMKWDGLTNLMMLLVEYKKMGKVYFGQ